MFVSKNVSQITQAEQFYQELLRLFIELIIKGGIYKAHGIVESTKDGTQAGKIHRK